MVDDFGPHAEDVRLLRRGHELPDGAVDGALQRELELLRRREAEDSFLDALVVAARDGVQNHGREPDVGLVLRDRLEFELERAILQ